MLPPSALATLPGLHRGGDESSRWTGKTVGMNGLSGGVLLADLSLVIPDLLSGSQCVTGVSALAKKSSVKRTDPSEESGVAVAEKKITAKRQAARAGRAGGSKTAEEMKSGMKSGRKIRTAPASAGQVSPARKKSVATAVTAAVKLEKAATALRKTTGKAKAEKLSPATKARSVTQKVERTVAAVSSSGFRSGTPQMPSPPADPYYRPQLSPEELRKIKSGLKKKDLVYFRDLLMERRAEILGDVASLDQSRAGQAGELSHMPLHMADVGSDNYEQEATLGLMEFERKMLREIEEALLRIDAGIYGVCMESGVPIPRIRLEAKPWAKYTIEVALERERLGLQP